MSNRRILVARFARGTAVLAIGWLCLGESPAATKAQRDGDAQDRVDKALLQGIEGDEETRNELLQMALQQAPNYPPARWHSGHIRHQNQWVRFDEVSRQLADDAKVAEYRRRRRQSPDTVPGHLALATWCRQRGLAERQRAHLTRVLEIDPEHAMARQLLGYQNVDGVWTSEREMAAAAIQAREAAKALAEWRPNLQEILVGLEHRTQKIRDEAQKELLAVDDPRAVLAIEQLLCRRSQSWARQAVDLISEIPGREASLALARQAVFSPWEPVRLASVDALKDRDLVYFVPALLSTMTTPVQTKAELYRAPTGRLMYRHLLYREGQEKADLAIVETEYRGTLLSAGPGLHGLGPNTYAFRRTLLEQLRQRDAVGKAQAVEAGVTDQNALIQRFNDAVCSVLSQTTGVQLPADPKEWWNWWNDYNGVVQEGSKPVKQSYHRDTVTFDDPADELTFIQGNQVTYVGYRGSTMAIRRSSCLLAGTLVWTDTGPIPIEEIRVGDLVLAQDADTGELAHKPVLKTTNRPPVRLWKLVLGDRALQCSDGHPFWVIDQGWIKACELKEGMRLHTLSGTVEVRSVHPTGTEALHNLVVADFHTYFITKDLLLTHDNTIREPTERIVPGLVRR